MKDELLERISALIERRSFLRRLVTVSGVFASGLLGLPKSAEASLCIEGTHKVGMCCLCKDQHKCSVDWKLKKDGGDCTCIWMWCKPEYAPPIYRIWCCYECFGGSSESCVDTCNGDVICSKAISF
jgi:hypothetical protein